MRVRKSEKGKERGRKIKSEELRRRVMKRWKNKDEERERERKREEEYIRILHCITEQIF